MARIAGIDLPRDKTAKYALPLIYGIGKHNVDELLAKAERKSPARELVGIDDVGVATAFLAHDAARLITGQVLYVDGGYHVVD